jgi:hypothetical protein
MRMNKIKCFIEDFKCGYFLEGLEHNSNTWKCIKYGLKSGIRGLKNER